MRLRVIMSIAIIFCVNFCCLGNTNPVAVMKIGGSKMEWALMVSEIEGPIQLFSDIRQVEEVVQINGTVSRTIVMINEKDYYIGRNNQVELITERNFKSVLKRYLKESPEVLKKIGKRGFRYENLPFMILFHNKKITKGKPLTKSDVKDWGTI